MPSSPRSPQQRRADTERRLARSNHLWIATASPTRPQPHLVPLSFAWTGTEVIVVTASRTPTAANIAESGVAQLAIGATDDVILVEATLREAVAVQEASEQLADAYARQSDWDPRAGTDSPSVYISLLPRRVRAWREVDEIPGRTIMKDGRWVR